MDSDETPPLKRPREGSPSHTRPRRGSPPSIGIRIVEGGGEKEEESPTPRRLDYSTGAMEPFFEEEDEEEEEEVEEDEESPPPQPLDYSTGAMEPFFEEEVEDEEEEEEEDESISTLPKIPFAVKTGKRSSRSFCSAPSSTQQWRIHFPSLETFSDDTFYMDEGFGCDGGSEKELQFTGELYHYFEDDFDDEDI